jgi:hypothetical protein
MALVKSLLAVELMWTINFLEFSSFLEYSQCSTVDVLSIAFSVSGGFPKGHLCFSQAYPSMCRRERGTYWGPLLLWLQKLSAQVLPGPE